MLEEMYIQMTLSRIDPQRLGQAVSELERRFGHTDCSAVSGLRQSLWLESLDDPGHVIWFSIWDSLEDCRSFMASAAYMRWGDAVQAYLWTEPHRYFYRILADLLAGHPGVVEDFGRR
jgi:heme-degrading monooxygenase HmoA